MIVGGTGLADVTYRQRACHAAVVLLLIAFATAKPTRQVAAEPAARDPWIAQGLLAVDRDALRALLAKGVNDGDLAGGSLILVRRHETIFREGAGFADWRAKRPYDVELPCRIASISKSFVASLVARLVEAGKLDFEEPIDRWIPEFKDVRLASGRRSPRVPLVRECLAHTAHAACSDCRSTPWAPLGLTCARS